MKNKNVNFSLVPHFHALALAHKITSNVVACIRLSRIYFYGLSFFLFLCFAIKKISFLSSQMPTWKWIWFVITDGNSIRHWLFLLIFFLSLHIFISTKFILTHIWHSNFLLPLLYFESNISRFEKLWTILMAICFPTHNKLRMRRELNWVLIIFLNINPNHILINFNYFFLLLYKNWKLLQNLLQKNNSRRFSL